MAKPIVTTELFYGGAWHEVPTYTQDPITATRTGGSYGKCILTFDNRDRTLDNRLPTSPLYGLIGPNTPMRVTIDGSIVFYGEVPQWTPRFNATGSVVYTPAEAAGVLRRLSQGARSLQSPLRRAITASDPVGYWPLEDSASATEAAPWDTARATPGIVRTGIRFAEAPDTLPGSARALAAQSSDTVAGAGLFTPGNIRFKVPGHTVGPETLTYWFQSDAFAQRTSTSAVTAATTHLVEFAGGGSIDHAYVVTYGYDPTGGFSSLIGYFVQFEDAAGGFLGTLYTGTSHPTWDPYDGAWHEVQLKLAQSGANVTVAIYIDGAVGDSTTLTGQTLSPIRGFAAGVHGAMQDSLANFVDPFRAPYSLAHLSVHDFSAPSFVVAGMGHAGETAGRRIERLCSEEGVAFTGTGDLDDTAAMGPQTRDPLVVLLRQAEAAGRGWLDELPGSTGLGYRTITSLYNQTPLTVDYTHIALPLVPVDDDAMLHNYVVVQRPNGGRSVATLDTGPLSTQAPPNGAGVYDRGPVTAHVHDDTGGLHLAHWLLRRGTWNERRYPTVSIDMAAPEVAADAAYKAALLGLEIGDRIRIVNLPSWLTPDAVDLMVDGYTITAYPHGVRLDLQTVPAGPYSVLTWSSFGTEPEPDAPARYDSDGTVTTAPFAAGTATGLAVAVRQGPVWSASSINLPYDVVTAGVRLRVTAVDTTIHDVFTRTVSNGWGAANSGQAWSTSGGSAADYSVGSSVGQVSHAAVGVTHVTALDTNLADVDVMLKVICPVTATGGSIFAAIWARGDGDTNHYRAELTFDTGGNVDLNLYRRVAGVTAPALATANNVITYSPGTPVDVRFQVIGSTLRAKVWTGPEPAAWTVEATDTTFTTGAVGTRSTLSAGNTNTLPLVLSFDTLDTINGQTFTVDQIPVNGVRKAVPVGSEVHLWQPAAWAYY